ncbi:Pyrimidine-specific ribonucleoside hydrolase RihB [bioreactor metagenome]|uniref:Pyrimidine-specific ribonucleoside hydrolase RihB n=1 Tax=bioreactor metagenome TaxID=1076179 RepID=A0A644YE36_9ZZZZ
MERKKLIIDTDCGSDDAMAIAMALMDEHYEILFFSVCSGNVCADQAVLNTLTTIEYAGSYEPPVYLGSSLALVKPLAFAHETHGNDGMGDIGLLPSRLKRAEGNGILKMLEALEQHSAGEIEIVALGPLTNLALAIRLAPETMRRVKRISIMGSAGLGTGNVTPASEFNIWQDPEAAKIVMESGLPLLFVGWDACLGESMLSPEEIEFIRQSGPLGRFAIDCNRCLMEMNAGRFGFNCLDMADPAAMAAALHPDCIDVCDAYYCEVDTSTGVSSGAVLVDIYGFSGKEPNAYICSKLKSDVYKDYIFRMLGAK